MFLSAILKFHQEVHIAVRSHFTIYGGAEQIQPFHPIIPAYLMDLAHPFRYQRGRHILLLSSFNLPQSGFSGRAAPPPTACPGAGAP